MVNKERATSSPKQLIELTGLFFILISLLIGLSLWTYNVSDPTLNQSVSASVDVKNAVGTFGAYLAGILVDFFGLLSYIWALFFFLMGLACITKRFVPRWYSIIGYIILCACFIVLAEFATFGIGDVQGGGFIGARLYVLLHQYFNPVGSVFVWFFAFIVALELCFHFSWVIIFSRIVLVFQKIMQKGSAKALPYAKEKFKTRKALPEANKTIDIEIKSAKTISKNETEPAETTKKEIKISKEDPFGLISSPLSFDEEDKNTATQSKREHSGKSENSDYKDDHQKNNSQAKNPQEKKKGFWHSVFFSDEEENIGENNNKSNKNNELPSTELLSPIPEEENMPTRESLDTKGETLIQCLLDFSVQGSLAGVLPGPVVTMFEVRPNKGVKASRFEALSKEIAMSIKAIAVRVQAPIPGTDTVGIEVPNDTRQVVSFREIIQSESFTKSNSVLSLGIGKDIFGKPVTVKMEEMPHLLVAGATGAGKSVCLNSIILSILYKARPHEVKMLLIDPKRVELAMYADLPHLVHPVVTDMDLAKNALLWAIDEMDQRYQLFQNNRVRNFNEYNTLVKKQRKEKEIDYDGDGKIDAADRAITKEITDPSVTVTHNLDMSGDDKAEKELPYIVIIVDELADLMMQKGKEVEGSIVRLAQLARAAGIHLIIATQRPSVDVVTGLIKANFPSRIAFQVTSGTDSRTILDTVGAEALLGKGDMLFKPRAGALRRMHGAFVTDEEVTQVVDFWKKGRKVEYTVDFTQYGPQATENAFSNKDDSYDPMFDTILERVLEMEEVSISMLQRLFKLGFGRAGRIIDQLERDGIVGPSSGSKPRKVLK